MDNAEMLIAYASGILPPDERARFEQELAASSVLQRELSELRAIQLALLESAPSAVPPPALRARLLARVANSNKKVPPLRPTQVFWQGFLRAASFAACAIALLSVGIAWQARRDFAAAQSALQLLTATQKESVRQLTEMNAKLNEAQVQVSTASAELVRIKTELASAQANANAATQINLQSTQSLGEMQREVDVLTQPNVRAANIPPLSDGFKRGVATVFFAPQSASAILSVANLPQLTPEQTYQVWLIKGKNLETRLPSVIFNTSDQGTRRVVVLSNEPFENFVGFGITVEPAGGRPTPNPAGPIFVGKLG